MSHHPSKLAGVLHVEGHTGSGILIQTWQDYQTNNDQGDSW